MKIKSKFYSVCMILLLVAIMSSCKNEHDAITSINTDDTVHLEADLADESLDVFNTIKTGNMIQYDNGHIYFQIGSAWSKNTLETFYRYNVRTGGLTAVCNDPLCQHNDRICPFYGMQYSFAIYGDKVVYDRYFFLKSDTANGEAYYETVSYDWKSRKLVQYSKEEGTVHTSYDKMLFADHYRFYYTWIENEATEEYYYSLCRMDMRNNSVAVLQSNASSKETSSVTNSALESEMLFAVNGRIYFTNGAEIYSTDFDLNDRNVIMRGRFTSDNIYTDGEYIYLGERETKDSSILTLYRANLDGSKKTALGIQAYRFTLTKKYIYYENTEVIILGKNKSTGKSLTQVGTALCRAAHDGSGQETVFSFVQEDTFYELGYTCYAGEYMYAIYNAYSDTNRDGAIDNDEVFNSYDPQNYTLLRVDLNTGEMDFIRCGTENRETP